MVLIFDGSSEIDAHVWSDLDYLSCTRHLFRSKRSDFFPSPERLIFLQSCATFYQLPSNISTVDITGETPRNSQANNCRTLTLYTIYSISLVHLFTVGSIVISGILRKGTNLLGYTVVIRLDIKILDKQYNYLLNNIC